MCFIKPFAYTVSRYLDCFPLARSGQPKRTGSGQFKWKDPRRANIFPATTLRIPALWPTGAGELSSSDTEEPFWPEPVLRTRALQLITDWSDQPDRTNGKRP